MMCPPCMPKLPRSGRGFTLIELMVTLTIAAILLAFGMPQMREFIADQRVRSAISDIHGDLVFARADALGNQRRTVVVAKTGMDWNAGWSVCVAATSTSFDCTGSPQILRSSQGWAAN